MSNTIDDSQYERCAVNDNGYDRQKVVYWKKEGGEWVMKYFSTPSRIKFGKENVTMDGAASGVYQVGEYCYTAGDRISRSVQNRNESYAYSAENLSLVHHALLGAGLQGRTLKLATGLPYEQFMYAGEINRALINKVKESMLMPIKSLSHEALATIEEHVVCGESMSAFIDHAFNRETLTLDIPDKPTVLIDVGGNTTDVTWIGAQGTGDDKSLIINTDRSKTLYKGMLDVKKKLQELLYKEHEIETEDHLLDDALRTGIYPIYRKDTDISELIKESTRTVAKEICNFVQGIIKDGSAVGDILLVGGGASLLEEHFKTLYDDIIVPEDPEYANGRGMLLHLTFLS